MKRIPFYLCNALYVVIFAFITCDAPINPYTDIDNVTISVKTDTSPNGLKWKINDSVPICVTVGYALLIDSVCIYLDSIEKINSFLLECSVADDTTITVHHIFSDTGIKKISAAAFNEDGEIIRSEELLISIGIAPSFKDQKEIQYSDIPTIGQPLDMFLPSVGTHPLEYMWYKDSVLIELRLHDTLHFDKIKKEDNGDYFCIVKNDWGYDTSKTTHLNVLDSSVAPVITDEPDDLQLLVNAKAEFSVVATGSSPLNYQWQKDKEDISGADKATYEITQVTLADDSTTYRCIVSNSKGSDTSKAALLTVTEIIEKPEITEHPSSQAVVVGGEVTFSVTATGTAPFEYQWLKNGYAVTGATEKTYLYTNASLDDNNANFRCIVSNSAGADTSEVAVLTVSQNIIKPDITKNPADTNAFVGENVCFSVEASGTAPLQYQWQKNSVNINGANGKIYRITGVDIADNNSQFRCIVSNTAGSDTSTEALLTVNDVPVEIIVHPQDQTALVGSNAIFTVTAEGTNLTYQWYKNGNTIQGATNSTLEIDSVTLENSGEKYTCLVANSANGKTSDEATLTVVEEVVPIEIVTQPKSTSVPEGAKATFSVTVTGTNPQFAWYKDNQPITGATLNSYTTPVVTMNDNGSLFKCIVKNKMNEVTSDEASLTVTMNPPVITTDPENKTVAENSSVTFTVGAIGTALHYQWIRIHNSVESNVGTDKGSYTIDPVTVDYQGDAFKCKVSNAGGEVTSEEATLTVTLNPPVITTDPENKTVAENSSVTFTIVAEGTALHYQWIRIHNSVESNVGTDNSSYTINPVTADYQGDAFKCKVSNTGGEVTSTEASLTVTLNAPVITDNPDNTSANEGGSAQFTVSAEGTDIHYQWKRIHNSVTSDVGSDNAVLAINPVKAEYDDDSYKCIVSNDGGSVSSDEATLDVIFKAPTITNQPDDETIYEGEDVSFFVHATSSGTISYDWEQYAGGTWSSVGTNSSSLYLSDVPLSYNGNKIRCKVSNEDAETVSEDATLTVNPQFINITAEPQDASVTTVGSGSSASFTVTAVAHTTDISYQWQYRPGGVGNFTDINGEVNSTLQLSNIQMHMDLYQYRCEVSAGDVVKNSNYATLTIKIAPTITVHPQANYIKFEGDNVTFNVVATGPSLSYTWYKDGSIISGAPNNNSYTITVLNKATHQGSYTVRVANHEGNVVSNASELYVYETVTISGQVWMAENAKHSVSSGNTGYPNNNASNVDDYGLLYDWDAAQEVCPSGWHLPSETEWQTLVANTSSSENASVLRQTEYWESGSHSDNFGFHARGAGTFFPGGSPTGFKEATQFGTSACSMWWSTIGIDLDIYVQCPLTSPPANMISIRCIKD